MSPTHAPIGRLLPARYVPDVEPSLRVPDEGSGRGWVKPATVAGVQCCDLAVVGNLGQLLVCACSVAAVQCNWVELREQ
jgi:hypothetical protein